MSWFDWVLVALAGPRLGRLLVLAFYGGGLLVLLLVAAVFGWAVLR